MSDEKKRILLVDDDAAILRGYKNVLTLRGFSVETATDGAEALARLGATDFDVIVSDVSMPTMGGLEFLRAIRERDLDVPVVLMTGDPSLDSAVRAVNYGACCYLIKPIEPQKLEDAIRRAARLHEMALLKREALEVASIEGNGSVTAQAWRPGSPWLWIGCGWRTSPS